VRPPSYPQLPEELRKLFEGIAGQTVPRLRNFLHQGSLLFRKRRLPFRIARVLGQPHKRMAGGDVGPASMVTRDSAGSRGIRSGGRTARHRSRAAPLAAMGLKAHKQLPALRDALEAHQSKNSHSVLARQANAA
jgi:hypothetical protein